MIKPNATKKDDYIKIRCVQFEEGKDTDENGKKLKGQPFGLRGGLEPGPYHHDRVVTLPVRNSLALRVLETVDVEGRKVEVPTGQLIFPWVLESVPSSKKFLYYKDEYLKQYKKDKAAAKKAEEARKKEAEASKVKPEAKSAQ